MQFYKLYTGYPQVVDNFSTITPMITHFFWVYYCIFYVFSMFQHTYPRFSLTFPQFITIPVDNLLTAIKKDQIAPFFSQFGLIIILDKFRSARPYLYRISLYRCAYRYRTDSKSVPHSFSRVLYCYYPDSGGLNKYVLYC